MEWNGWPEVTRMAGSIHPMGERRQMSVAFGYKKSADCRATDHLGLEQVAILYESGWMEWNERSVDSRLAMLHQHYIVIEATRFLLHLLCVFGCSC